MVSEMVHVLKLCKRFNNTHAHCYTYGVICATCLTFSLFFSSFVQVHIIWIRAKRDPCDPFLIPKVIM